MSLSDFQSHVAGRTFSAYTNSDSTVDVVVDDKCHKLRVDRGPGDEARVIDPDGVVLNAHLKPSGMNGASFKLAFPDI